MQVLFRSQFKDLQEKKSDTRQDTTQLTCILFLSPSPLLLRESAGLSQPAVIPKAGFLQYKVNQATLSLMLLQQRPKQISHFKGNVGQFNCFRGNLGISQVPT